MMYAAGARNRGEATTVSKDKTNADIQYESQKDQGHFLLISLPNGGQF